MHHVDALSRFPSILVLESALISQVKVRQREDKECQLILELLKNGDFEDYAMRGDVLYRFKNGNYVLVIPKVMQNQLIRSVHERGHICAAKTEAVIRQDYDISELKKKIEKVISNCVCCILAARKAGKKEGYLHPIDKHGVPLHTYHIDHFGPMESTAKSYKHVLVIVDAFTKFVWLYPVKSTTVEEAVSKLEFQSNIFGNPYRIISDKGSAFRSNLFEKYCADNHIEHLSITTGVPRGNGQCERLNAVVINSLAKMSVEDPKLWYKHVAKLQKFINSTIARSTKRSPFELLIGVPMRDAFDANLAKLLEDEVFDRFHIERQEMRDEARQNIEKLQQENIRTYDKNRKEARKYALGELIAMQRTQFLPGSKLMPKFLGPYEVTKVKRNDRYEVRKVGVHEGPNVSSTASDLMKPWSVCEDELSSGTDD